MKKPILLGSLLSAIFVSPFAIAGHPGHDTVEVQNRLQEIHLHLTKMEATIDNMQSANSESERKKLLNEHSEVMDTGVALLKDMHDMEPFKNGAQSAEIGAEIDLLQMLMRMKSLQRSYDATVSRGLEL